MAFLLDFSAPAILGAWCSTPSRAERTVSEDVTMHTDTPMHAQTELIMKLETIAASVALAPTTRKAAYSGQSLDSLLLPAQLEGKLLPVQLCRRRRWQRNQRIESQYLELHNASGVCRFAKRNYKLLINKTSN
jgi:hypothetical protein